jgi:hypothetical protein
MVLSKAGTGRALCAFNLRLQLCLFFKRTPRQTLLHLFHRNITVVKSRLLYDLRRRVGFSGIGTDRQRQDTTQHEYFHVYTFMQVVNLYELESSQLD